MIGFGSTVTASRSTGAHPAAHSKSKTPAYRTQKSSQIDPITIAQPPVFKNRFPTENQIGYFRGVTQTIFPPLPATSAPDFTPVPRATKRWNGITALKQRTFIDNLAGSGCVTMAASSIGTSTSAMYQLRKAEGAESFAAAWDSAVDAGARRVLDLLMEHAIHGTPETLLKGGEVILERRKYNTRAMMWIVSQRFPELFGSATGLMEMNGLSGPIKKLKAKWEAEWREQYEKAADLSAVARRAEEEAQRELDRRELLPAARSLLHLELYMEFGGLVEPEITAFLDTASEAPHPRETEAGKAIEAHRHAQWAKEEKELGIMRPAPVRHALLEGGTLMGGTLNGGPTSSERTKARQQAEVQMAEAQRLWEACATEEGWAARGE